MTRIEKMKSLINRALLPSFLEVIDDSHQHAGHAGSQQGKGHYTIKIQSNSFNDKPLLECHRMVYQALDSMMQDEIHALVIKIVRAAS